MTTTAARAAPMRLLVIAAAVATAVLFTLMGLVHNNTSFHSDVYAHVAHHRMLRELSTTSSLQLLFHAKRESMKIHGHTDFTVFVEPSTTATPSDVFEFNGITTFVDSETTHIYSLVDGIAYYSSSHTNESTVPTTAVVVPTSELPPIHKLLEALASAVPLDHVETTQKIDCAASSQLFHARFADQDFVVCSFSTDETSGLRVFGEDFDVEIRTGTAKNPPAEIIKPSSIAEPSTATAVLPRSTHRVPSLLEGLMRTTVDSVSRKLFSSAETTRPRRLELQAASCSSCKSKPRPCIFFHGMDIKADGGLVDEFDFFGDIKNHAPCCSTIKFAVLNTVDYGWNNASLVDKACAYALSMSETSHLATRTIEDTIVVAHSMGNLMVAHAEATGKCTLGNSSSWVALSGPFTGSMGSNFQQQICEGQYFGKEIVAAVVALFGQCPQSKARQALTYEGGNFSSTELNAQYAKAQAIHAKRVTASVCGYTSNGLLSKDLLGLVLGGSILPHKSKENDGVVEFQSCRGDLAATTFAENWSSAFYRAKLNHADTTFKHGDAWLDNQKKPVKWFECLAL